MVAIVRPKDQVATPRDAAIEAYIGHTGRIIEYYWVRPEKQEFYIYTVRIDSSEEEIVVHEDEIEALIE